jgi:hypothetical protein
MKQKSPLLRNAELEKSGQLVFLKARIGSIAPDSAAWLSRGHDYLPWIGH